MERDKEGGAGFLGVLAAVAVALVLGGTFLYRHEARAIRAQKYAELRAISAMKTASLSAWRQERLNDAALNATGLIRELTGRWLKAPADAAAKAALLRRMRAFQEQYGYADVLLASPDGKVRLSLDPKCGSPLVRAAFDPKGAMGDFFRCPTCGRMHLDTAAAIPGPGGRPAALLVLRTDPERYLYPLIQSWPIPSKTAETLLVRREDDAVVFLNELRHRPDPPVSLRVPLSRADVAAVQAALGRTGIFEGKDYRGQKVLSEIRAVPGTSWSIVSKVDAEEFLSELRYRGGVISVFVILALLMAAGAGLLVRGAREKRLYEDMLAARRERDEAVLESEKKFRRMVEDLRHEYFFFRHDPQGVFTYMSPSVEAVLGYKPEECREDVPAPVNEDALRCKEGTLQGMQQLPYLMTVRHKSGELRTLRVTEHPAFGPDGKVAAVEGFACDVTETQQVEKRLRILLGILQHPAPDVQTFLDFALEEAIRLTGSSIGYIYFYHEDRRQFVLNSWSKGVMDQCTVIEQQTVYDLDKTGVWGEAVRQRAPIILNDFAAPHPLKRGLPEGHSPLKRFMTVPVFSRGAIVAVVGVANKAAEYDEEDTLQLSLLMVAVWKNVERMRADEALRQSEDKLRLILDSTAEGIYAIDLKGCCTLVNPSCLRMLGFKSEQDVLGRNMHELIHHSKPDGTPYPVKDCLIFKALYEKRGSHVDDEVFWRANGSTFPVEYWSYPMLRGSEQVGAVIAFVDITGRRESERRLQEAMRLKSDFINMAAHELRTPLTAIKMAVDIVQDETLGRLNEEQRPFLDASKRNVDRLVRLINDVLDLQKMDVGRSEFRIRPELLGPLLEEAADTFRLVAEQKGLRLELDVPAGLPELRFDRDRISQVLANYLSNALKFTPAGRIRLSAGVLGRWVMVSVADQGPGISKEDAGKLFKSFAQLEAGRSAGGTGLGLALVKQIVEHHGGTVGVDSEPGRGATFWFTLPTGDAHA